MSNVGKLVRQVRRQQDRLSKDVAAAIKMTPGYLSDIERGRLIGTPATLQAIGRELGIDEKLLRAKYIQDTREAAERQWLDNAGRRKYRKKADTEQSATDNV